MVVQALELEQHDAQEPRAQRRFRLGRRLDCLTEGERVADARVAGNALGELHAGHRIAPLEQLLGALVREVQARLHVDDRLAHDAEPKMTGLDDAGVHRADRNLVHPFPADRRERKRPPVVGKRRRVRILAQRVIVLGPERVLHQRTRIRVTEDVDAEQIAQLALEARRRIV